MSDIMTAKDLNLWYDQTQALKNVSIKIPEKSITAFIGPSGCGKSTILRLISGLEEISAGEISIDGKVVNNIHPKDRDIAFVFQSYALYPHMSVYDNIAFGLKMRKYNSVI